MRGSVGGEGGGGGLGIAGLSLAVAAAAWGPSGCTTPTPMALSPETAMPACQAEALREARRIDPSVQSVELEPLASAEVERRSPPPGREGVALVIQGHGS